MSFGVKVGVFLNVLFPFLQFLQFVSAFRIAQGHEASQIPFVRGFVEKLAHRLVFLMDGGYLSFVFFELLDVDRSVGAFMLSERWKLRPLAYCFVSVGKPLSKSGGNV